MYTAVVGRLSLGVSLSHCHVRLLSSFQWIADELLSPPPDPLDFHCLVPDGKPQVTSAHNTSSTSIYLSWKPPPRSSIHGEFLGYRLAYRQRDAGSDSVQEIFLRDPSIEVRFNPVVISPLRNSVLIWATIHFDQQSHTLQGLETFTQYMISLQVFNPEGLGPSTTVIVMTDEGGKIDISPNFHSPTDH